MAEECHRLLSSCREGSHAAWYARTEALCGASENNRERVAAEKAGAFFSAHLREGRVRFKGFERDGGNISGEGGLAGAGSALRKCSADAEPATLLVCAVGDALRGDHSLSR